MVAYSYEIISRENYVLRTVSRVDFGLELEIAGEPTEGDAEKLKYGQVLDSHSRSLYVMRGCVSIFRSRF